MVDTITAFRASDGKIFANKLNAAQHDASIQLTEILGDAVNTASLTKIIDRALDVWNALAGPAQVLIEEEAGKRQAHQPEPSLLPGAH